MPRLLAFPFRLAANGRAATVEQDDELGDAQRVAAIATTVRGERELVPGFGITDPTLAGIDPAELAAGVALYGPDVRIGPITVRPLSDTAQAVAVTFD